MLMSRRAVVGSLWIVAAVLCFFAVAADPMSLASPQQWATAYSQPEIARGLAIAMVLATVGLLGLGWRRWTGRGTPDRRLPEEPPELGRQVWLGRLGLVLMVAGALVVVGDWLSAHRAVPAGELVLPLNESMETVEVTQGARSVDVMLPLRTTLRGLRLGDDPVAEVQFARPDQQGVAPREFRPAQSLDIDGMRFVFSGFATETTRLRAVLSSPDENTIEAAGVAGDEIQLSVDGPIYRIVDATTDFLDVFAPAPNVDEAQAQLMLMAQGYPLGVMGPAVQLEDEQGRTFWVFQRSGLGQDISGVEQNLRLDELQEVPSAVMTITDVRPIWPFSLGIVLFVIGWALLFGFPERIIRRRRDGTIWLWSFNQVESANSLADHKGQGASSWLGIVSPVVALLALGLAYLLAANEGAILLFAGFVAVLALPPGLDDSAGRRAALVAASVPVGVMVGVAVAMDTPALAISMRVESLLWTAQIGSWLAMATALVAAGVLAEGSLGRRSTGGAVSVGLAIWAAMGAMVAVGMQRAQMVDDLMGLPLVSEGHPVVWSIPTVLAASELEIPVVAGAGELAMITIAVGLLTALAVVGTSLQKTKMALFGWAGSALTSLSGLAYLFGVGTGGGAQQLPDAQPYERLGSTWLQARDLPTWLADEGAFETGTSVEIATTALIPEILALSTAALLALVMFGSLWLRRDKGDALTTVNSSRGALAGRDYFVRALMFGMMGWVLGLVLAWENLGAAGILAPMEWLGASVLMAGVGLLLIGWRSGPSAPQQFVRAFGPGLVLCYLVWVLAVGAVAGVAPGASVAFLP